MSSWYYYADSWVEISSQPSSSSLSSIGDEVITTGLNVQNRRDPRRRRRLNAMIANNMRSSPRPASAAGSSQDEYDESSSESDRVMSSSNEDVGHQNEDNSPPQDERHDSADEDEDDEDDTSTALGTGTADTVFTPQPNAFTHPPSSQASSIPSSTSLPPSGSYFPSPPADRLPSNRTITARDLRRPSTTRSQRSSHTPYNMISPSHTYQPDHDAALRASLSTLLSCAAAARGLPKRDAPSRSTARRPGADTIDTNTLRMVPESELMAHETSPPLPVRRYTEVPSSSSSAPSPPASVKANLAAVAKRKAVRESSKDRHSKKSRGSSAARGNSSVDESAISPTLMTWMVSAGVVILFSAISFSAGFVLGREVGHMEAGGTGVADLGSQGGGCGRELASRADGLRRLRWSSGGTSSIRA
ncbi:hypothetical protein UCRPC4_g05929 [Phaeomoniella chlamydospora]|uniref:Uncharacterized protein n=1 Tax=Phaeomoniella chlamydospora TaxID=158046 RepID=A0A0G2GHI3_PHACM|nr:hypothetical protein UCRPC4_g05929 [Phaeomoniella chlamydospora]